MPVNESLSLTRSVRGQWGRLDLMYGTYALDIETGYPPSHVYVCIESEDAPVCHGDLSWTCAQASEFGFTLYATVRSNVATVYYLAERP